MISRNQEKKMITEKGVSDTSDSKEREFSGITKEIWEQGERIEERYWAEVKAYVQKKIAHRDK